MKASCIEPKVERVFGLHIWASSPTGDVLVVPGAIFAAATHFRIIIKGRGGHASAPHQTVDPIVVAAHAIVALQTVVSRTVDPEETAVSHRSAASRAACAATSSRTR